VRIESGRGSELTMRDQVLAAAVAVILSSRTSSDATWFGSLGRAPRPEESAVSPDRDLVLTLPSAGEDPG